MKDSGFVKFAQVLRSALMIVMLLCVLWIGVELKVVQHQMCERLNGFGVSYQTQWKPVVQNPPPTLPPNPTQAQRDAYNASTDLRTHFTEDFHKFDPVKC